MISPLTKDINIQVGAESVVPPSKKNANQGMKLHESIWPGGVTLCQTPLCAYCHKELVGSWKGKLALVQFALDRPAVVMHQGRIYKKKKGGGGGGGGGGG